MKGGARGAAVGGVVILVLIAVGGWVLVLAAGGESGESVHTVERNALVDAHRAHAAITLIEDSFGADVVRADALRAAQATVLQAVAAVAEFDSAGRWSSVDALLVRSLELLQRLEQTADSSDGTALIADLRRISTDLRAEIDAAGSGDALSPAAPADGGVVPVVLAVLAFLLGAYAIVLLLRPARAGSSGGDLSTSGSAQPRAATAAAVARPVGGVTTDVSAVAAIEGIGSADDFAAVTERERQRSVRYGHPLALIELVVEQAEAIRSGHGEAALEYVVGSVAELARDNTRSADTVAVVGTDRVGVLLPETSVEHADTVADKLCRSVALFPFSDGIHATVTSACRELLDDSPSISP
ncbi:MAG: GGDEF domain-containing protein [Spirochaetota bacterium]